MEPDDQPVEGVSESVQDETLGQPVENESQEPNDGLASSFLSKIPEEDRPIVEKYVKQWDGGVTRRFQELHGQYRPYKELGPVEDIQKAVQIANFLRENPEQLYQFLHEQYSQQPQALQPQTPQTPVQPGTPNAQNPFEGLPEEYQPLAQFWDQQYGSKLTQYGETVSKLEKGLETIASHLIAQVEATARQQEDRELDAYMSNLHDEFGDFDDRYVLTLISQGISAEKAVKQFNDTVQARVNASRRPDPSIPAVLSGGGGTPSVAKSPAEMSKQEVIQFNADILRRVQEANKGS